MGIGNSAPVIPIKLDPMVMKYESDIDDWSEGKVTLGNGNVRNVMQWIPKSGNIKGLIVFVHGVYEHALVYDKLAHALTAKGFACHSIDHYAHGLSATSPESLGYVDKHEFLYEDLIEFFKFVRSKPGNADLPLFIFAHSMGTLLTSIALTKVDNVKAVVFSGAAFNPGPGSASPMGLSILYPINFIPYIHNLARITAQNDPRGIGSYLWVDEITSTKDYINKIRCDQRSYQLPSCNMSVYEVLKIVKKGQELVSEVNVPFFAIHGGRDVITYPSGTNILMKKSKTPDNLKSKKIYQEGKHHTIHEVDAISKPAIEDIVKYYESFY